MKIPSRSADKTGHDDEGISSVLNKPRDFRYTDEFLKWWYTEMGTDTNEYLHTDKMVLLQIGKKFYALKEWETLPNSGKDSIDRLEVIMEKFDVKLLKEKEE